MGHWPLHWSVKYPFILVASFAVLFAELSLAGAPDVHRPAAERPQVSVRKRGGRRRAALPRRRHRARRHDPVAELQRHHQEVTAPTPRWPASTSSVRAGELLAVLGPNGAGKSTAIGLWLGLIEADAGEVTLLGGSPQDIEPPPRPRRDDAGRGDVQGAAACASSSRSRRATTPIRCSVEETLRRAGIAALADRPYGKLSGGQKRQAQFAVAICGQPAGAVPRRAHGRPRRAGARGLVGQRAQAARRRLLHRADHALSGRSRGAGRLASP